MQQHVQTPTVKPDDTLEEPEGPSLAKMASPDPLNLLQRFHASGNNRHRFWRRARRIFGILLLFMVAVGIYVWLIQRDVVAETEIFQGVTYTCERMPETEESGGLVHLVRVDLNAPGIELYTTPIDPSVTSPDWEYRLKIPSEVLNENDLAVVINATQFSSDSVSFELSGKEWPIRLSGDLARSKEMIVSDHVLNGADRNHPLLWFEDDLTPHLELEKDPPPEVISRARWGIGARGVLVKGGTLQPDHEDGPDALTLVGISPGEKILWLAVFEKASPRAAANVLITRGAMDVVRVDGGDSSSIAIGAEARNIRPGIIQNGWMPVACYFGVRARPIGD